MWKNLIQWLRDWANAETFQSNQQVNLYLFEVDGKEAIVLGAHGHFGHIHQGNLGLDLPRLLIGKKEVVTC